MKADTVWPASGMAEDEPCEAGHLYLGTCLNACRDSHVKLVWIDDPSKGAILAVHNLMEIA
jgi:hypothetical protein